MIKLKQVVTFVESSRFNQLVIYYIEKRVKENNRDVDFFIGGLFIKFLGLLLGLKMADYTIV